VTVTAAVAVAVAVAVVLVTDAELLDVGDAADVVGAGAGPLVHAAPIAHEAATRRAGVRIRMDITPTVCRSARRSSTRARLARRPSR
jgi:hypothetical protein